MQEPIPIKTERIDNQDGTYTLKNIYSKDDENFEGYLSSIDIYNKDNKIIRGKNFYDNDFKELFAECIVLYNEDLSYTVNLKYSDRTVNGSLSEIQKYSADGSMYYAELYKDNDFHNKLETSFYKYNEDDTYTENRRYHLFNISEIYKRSKDNRILLLNIYIGKIFKVELLKEEYIYNSNGTYICRRALANKSSIEEAYKILKIHMDDTKYLYNKHYKDYIQEIAYNCIDMGGNPNNLSHLSEEYYYDSKNRLEKKIYYDYKSFKQICQTVYYSYNTDETWISKTIFSRPNIDAYLSTIEIFDKNNFGIKLFSYSDNNFQNLICSANRMIKDNDSYTTFIYEFPTTITDNLFMMREVVESDRNNTIKSHYCYKDKDGKDLILEQHWEYSKNNSYVIYSKFFNCNELARKEFYNSNGDLIKIIFYEDNNFNKKDSICYKKYQRKNEVISIRIRETDIDGYYSLIGKYIDGKTVWEHRYKFKGLFAKIIFWLSR